MFFPWEKKSGTKKEHKPKLLSPDIFWWGEGLPRDGVGAKKFGMSLETQGIKLFWQDIPGFCRDIPEAPEKFEKQMFGFNFWPIKNQGEFTNKKKTNSRIAPIFVIIFLAFPGKRPRIHKNTPLLRTHWGVGLCLVWFCWNDS